MYKRLFLVGGLTALSRITGFARDILLGALLGAGPLADAFYIAFRLPNHFRAIFGEGAFNSAFVPSYARELETRGEPNAKAFADRIFALLLASQIVFLVLALVFTRQLLAVLAPGLDSQPDKLAHAIVMTRIAFPYLLCMTLMMLQAGVLNAHRRFFAAAFAPVMLNLSMLAFLSLFRWFPNAGLAASWGVFAAGLAQLAVTTFAAGRAGVLPAPAWPVGDRAVAVFFKSFVPAVIGSAGVQIALFADTIIASMLPTGGISTIYYADRIYQLPIGVIGAAAGTVLLPEMSRRKSAGDHGAATHAQSRTMALTIALAAPFCVVFLMIPDLIMRGIFVRGRFDDSVAAAAGAVLAAYGLGLVAVVLISSARASFQSHGDTTFPMIASLVAVAVNVALKVALFRPYGAPGLAFATAVGAWLNLSILAWFALGRGFMRLDRPFWGICGATLAGCAGVALAAWLSPAPAAAIAAGVPAAFRATAQLALVAVLCGLAYAAVVAPVLAGLGLLPRLGGGFKSAAQRP